MTRTTLWSAAEGDVPLSYMKPLSTGTVTVNGATPVAVSDKNVVAGTFVIFMLAAVGGTPGAAPYVAAITPGTGFSVAAAAGDTSTYSYAVIG
jgi:hypothetical protein